MMNGFSKTIKIFGNEAIERSDSIPRGAAFTTCSRIVEGTPVKTGKARGNWRVGINQAPEGEIERRGAEASIREIRSALKAGVSREVVFFVNNVKYIRMLEYGSPRKQKGEAGPAAMVRKNAAQWKDTVRQTAGTFV